MQSAGVVDLGDAGRLELRARDRREVEVALAAARVEARERRVDLLADLVAAATGAGPDQRGHRARRRRRRAAPRRPPPRCPRRRRASRACSAATAPPAASSTGRQSAVNTSAGWPSSAVAWPSSSAGGRCGPGRLGGAPDGRSVHLPAVQEALARAARGGRHAVAVLVHVGAVVSGQPAEVERGERPRRDAAAARREQRAGRPAGRPRCARPPSGTARAAAEVWPSPSGMLGAGRRQAGGELCLAVGARPSSIASVAASSATPTGGPPRPAATKSLP